VGYARYHGAMPVIDAHAHFEPRILDLPEMIQKMDSAGVDKTVLIPTMNDPLPKTPELVLSVLRRIMNSRLHPLARRINDRYFNDDGNLVLGGEIFRIYEHPDNQPVADALAKYPDRFLGWIFLNPRGAAPLDELERWRAIPGYVGVKLHPHWHRYSTVDVLPIARRCEELRMPILIHLGFGERGEWKRITDACPNLRMIFAHAGMPHFGRMWNEVRDNANLRVDLSSPYLDERLVRQAVAALGPHRALYGTDAPYGFHLPDDTYNYGHIKGWVERMPNSASDVDWMLGANVEELLSEKR
jgi:predicted TIM-barrel fold metal-dependent hydrolase